jgi:hypothetical protein
LEQLLHTNLLGAHLLAAQPLALLQAEPPEPEE